MSKSHKREKPFDIKDFRNDKTRDKTQSDLSSVCAFVFGSPKKNGRRRISLRRWRFIYVYALPDDVFLTGRKAEYHPCLFTEDSWTVFRLCLFFLFVRQSIIVSLFFSFCASFYSAAYWTPTARGSGINDRFPFVSFIANPIYTLWTSLCELFREQFSVCFVIPFFCKLGKLCNQIIKASFNDLSRATGTTHSAFSCW